MKINSIITGITLFAIAFLSSCGGSGSSAESCMIFGDVPGLYADYQTQSDKIKQAAEKSEADYKKASAQIDELKEEYRGKIEEAGKKLAGQSIEIAPGEDFKIVAPVTLEFKEFANSINAVFIVGGDIEAAKDIAIEVSESWLKSHDVQYSHLPLLLVGCDEQGTEVTSAKIGIFKGLQAIDGKLVLPAGSKAELQTVAYNSNDYDNYIQVKSVKLALDTSKL